MPNNNYYKILGIQPSATLSEIKKAYKTLAVKWHPDKHPPEEKQEAESRFKEILEAYQGLTKVQQEDGEEKNNQEAKSAPDSSSDSDATFYRTQFTSSEHPFAVPRFHFFSQAPFGESFFMFTGVYSSEVRPEDIPFVFAQQYSDPKKQFYTSKEGFSPLHHAVYTNNYYQLKTLLYDDKTKLTTLNGLDQTAFDLAINNGNEGSIGIFLKMFKEQRDPLCFLEILQRGLNTATEAGNVYVVKYILHIFQFVDKLNRYKLLTYKNAEGYSAEEIASRNGNATFLKILTLAKAFKMIEIEELLFLYDVPFVSDADKENVEQTQRNFTDYLAQYRTVFKNKLSRIENIESMGMDTRYSHLTKTIICIIKDALNEYREYSNEQALTFYEKMDMIMLLRGLDDILDSGGTIEDLKKQVGSLLHQRNVAITTNDFCLKWPHDFMNGVSQQLSTKLEINRIDFSKLLEHDEQLYGTPQFPSAWLLSSQYTDQYKDTTHFFVGFNYSCLTKDKIFDTRIILRTIFSTYDNRLLENIHKSLTNNSNAYHAKYNYLHEHVFSLHYAYIGGEQVKTSAEFAMIQEAIAEQMIANVTSDAASEKDAANKVKELIQEHPFIAHTTGYYFYDDTSTVSTLFKGEKSLKASQEALKHEMNNLRMRAGI